MNLATPSDRGTLMLTLNEQTLTAAATIAPQGDVVRLSGATAIATITPRIALPHTIVLYSTSDNVQLLDTGNIAVALTIGPNFMLALIWSQSAGKWLYPAGSAF